LPRLLVRTNARRSEYVVRIGGGILSAAGKTARAAFGKQSQRVALISNQKVFSLYGSKVIKSLESNGFITSHWLMGDGERNKTVRALEKAVEYLRTNGLERGDGVIALGGGVVGDLAGFAAAIYLRGLPVIQVPTTLLSQIDSSIGGKTGVNLPAGKNLVGSFHQPRAVIIDIETLVTLPAREMVAGWCEAVKQGAVAGERLFKLTTNFLQTSWGSQRLVSSQLEKLIAAHCAFKASIVSADEREDVTRRDHRSRRILNFGHTIGHALESVTGYRRFRHGEAVGHGMLVAGSLSKNLGLLDHPELELLKQAVSLCGPLPAANDLDDNTVADAIRQDKKRSGGRVQWVLLERIGRPVIVDGREIGLKLLKQSLREGLVNIPGRH
jgi:3-dehydroquinate synthase